MGMGPSQKITRNEIIAIAVASVVLAAIVNRFCGLMAMK